MAGTENDALKPTESDKQSDVKEATKRPQVEVLDLMEERAQQAKALAADYASGAERFTVGDGGLKIEDSDAGEDQAERELPAEAKPESNRFTVGDGGFQIVDGQNPDSWLPPEHHENSDHGDKPASPPGTGPRAPEAFPRPTEQPQPEPVVSPYLFPKHDRSFPPAGTESRESPKPPVTDGRDQTIPPPGSETAPSRMNESRLAGDSAVFPEVGNLLGESALGDGAQPAKADVEKQGDKVSKVTYPNGQQLEFGYGPDGQLSKISDAKNGDHWEKQTDGSWKHLDKNNAEIPAQPGDIIDPKQVEDVRVNDEGGICTIMKDGRVVRENPDLSTDEYLKDRQIFTSSDGSEKEVHDNGVLVTRSADGKVEVEPKPWGPDSDKWEEYVPHKQHPAYRDDPPGTKYYRHQDGPELRVYPDKRYEHVFRDENGKPHKVTYDPSTGNRTEEIESGSSKTTVTRDRNGKEVNT